MNKPVQQRKIDTVFTLLLFSCFSMAVLITLMLGVNFYQHMTDISSEGYDERTSLSYIWTKIKNNDGAEKISVGSFGGIPALYFYGDTTGDTIFATRIYPYNGWVYELYSDVNLELDPEDGTPIIRAESLSFEQLDRGMVRVSAGSYSVLIYPRSKSGIVKGVLN
jgi:hypothetical protein